MIKCEVCFDEYPEGTLDLHRETCVLRLVFRCSVCGEDYVSREGLWNHVYVHDILDDFNESHYHEVVAKYKLFQCFLCNNQRAYSKSCFRIHVSTVHGNGKTRNQTVVREFNVLAEEAVSTSNERTISEEPVEKLRVKQIDEACQGLDHRLTEQSAVNVSGDTANDTTKESELSTEYSINVHGDGVARDQTVASDFNVLAEEPVSINVEHMASEDKPMQQSQTDQNNEDTENLPEDETKAELANKHQTMPKHRRRRRVRYESPVRNKSGDLVWPCSPCKLTFQRKSRQIRHVVAYHEEPLLKCSYCQKMFHFKFQLRRHVQACSQLHCHVCDIMFSTRPMLNVHMMDKHSQVSQPKNEEASNAETFDNVMGESNSSERPNELVVPYEPAKGIVCNICGCSFNKRNALYNHKVASHTEPRYQCSICKKMIHFAYELRRHLKFCSARRCDECGIMLGSRALLDVHRDVHKISEHPQENESTVVEAQGSESSIIDIDRKCRKVRSKSYTGRYFLRSIKTQKKYPEDKEGTTPELRGCSKQPKNSTSTASHDSKKEATGTETLEKAIGESNFSELGNKPAVGSETGEKVFPCPICGRTFTKPNSLWAHKTASHTEPERKCPICQKLFHFAYEVRRHLNFCSARRCHKCGILFDSRSQLDEHNINKHSEI